MDNSPNYRGNADLLDGKLASLMEIILDTLISLKKFLDYLWDKTNAKTILSFKLN